MSSIWTPSGEQPIEPERPGSGLLGPHGAPAGSGDDPQGGLLGAEDEQFTTEELDELGRIAAEMRATDVADIIANHAIGLFQVSLLHLGLGVPDEMGAPPDLEQARLAIDAMGALVEGLEGRLGHHREPLEQGLSQVRLLFVQVSQVLDEGAAADAGSSDSDA